MIDDAWSGAEADESDVAAELDLREQLLEAIGSAESLSVLAHVARDPRLDDARSCGLEELLHFTRSPVAMRTLIGALRDELRVRTIDELFAEHGLREWLRGRKELALEGELHRALDGLFTDELYRPVEEDRLALARAPRDARALNAQATSRGVEDVLSEPIVVLLPGLEPYQELIERPEMRSRTIEEAIIELSLRRPPAWAEATRSASWGAVDRARATRPRG